MNRWAKTLVYFKTIFCCCWHIFKPMLLKGLGLLLFGELGPCEAGTSFFMAQSSRSIKWNQLTHCMVNECCYFHVAHTDSFLFGICQGEPDLTDYFKNKQQIYHMMQRLQNGILAEHMLDSRSSSVSFHMSFCSAASLLDYLRAFYRRCNWV